MGPAGCTSDEDRAASVSRELARSLAKPMPDTAAPGAPGVQGVPKLYVDATKSMAGFVGCRQRRTFDAILARTATDLGVSRVWLFGEQSNTPGLLAEHALDHGVHCPETYNRLHNPDFALVEAIGRDTRTAVHVYFTDGVQSATDAGVPSPSVRALQQWIGGGRALAVLVFRGTFSGPAWSEELQQWTDTVTVKDRPFYAFLFARSESDIDRLLERLSGPVRQSAEVIRVTGAFPQCGVQTAAQHYAKMDSPPWAMLPPSLTRRLATGAAEVGAYECRIPREFPLETVLARTAGTYRKWQGSAFAQQPGAMPAGASFSTDSVLPTEGGSRVLLIARVPDDPSTRFGFYALELLPKPGRLRGAVDSLTTDTDAAASTYRRTYRFGWMLEHLVRSEFERRGAPRQYFITVQYR